MMMGDRGEALGGLPQLKEGAIRWAAGLGLRPAGECLIKTFACQSALIRHEICTIH
ncbi:hypothetical protein N007_18725 [Alicyclobacillus acidoterrestris ATCC 49025]|nr:hypothetical protein N007_18725 [Alicyclobacillus acidoterrestris ATCC 49025]